MVVDNEAGVGEAQSAELREAVISFGGHYVPSTGNIGFGAGHNLAMASQNSPAQEFHLMVNPDISFEVETIVRLIQEMRRRPDVGLLMPKVLYENGLFQPVCKLLPTPIDFALRRFAPNFIKRAFQNQLDRYELVGIEDCECDKVPFLSGCFLLTRRSVLDQVGGFDDRFFLYLEDVDLCRRLAQHSTLLYWPYVSVVHGCYRGAYRNRALLVLFLRSAIKYFNKWGWFFDKARRTSNKRALDCVGGRP